jgi:CRP-like cAMP-binding protein
LVNWIQAKRVKADTWIFLDENQNWLRASQIPELKMFFQPGSHSIASGAARPAPGTGSQAGIEASSLRRIRILAGLDDRQLESFLQFLEVIALEPFRTVVRNGDHGDAMFFVLDGEVRARVIIDGKESTLSTMEAGDFFGEISLLDHGPRSADIIANKQSILLKISTAGFERMVREAPEVATPFLYALARSVASRVRVLTKKYQDSIHVARIASTIH